MSKFVKVFTKGAVDTFAKIESVATKADKSEDADKSAGKDGGKEETQFVLSTGPPNMKGSEPLVVNKQQNVRYDLAAKVIQKWFRKTQARLALQRQLQWQLYTQMEYTQEHETQKMSDFFTSLLRKFDADGLAGRERCELLAEMPTSNRPTVMDVDKELAFAEDVFLSTYDRFPKIDVINIKPNDIAQMIDAFKAKHFLPDKYILQILAYTFRALKKQPNVNKIYVDNSVRVVVVGDLHGSLDDLVNILSDNGLPGHHNFYIFNGDFVDRGNYSIEVMCLVLSLFLMAPDCVFINRGNHEDDQMSTHYGFAKEINRKCGRDRIGRIQKSFNSVFLVMPLAVVINDAIVIAHGGVSRRVIDGWDTLLGTDIERLQMTSFLQPSFTKGLFTRMTNAKLIDQWQMLVDLLWSDPTNDITDEAENKKRGGGVLFGPYITEEFLKKYNYDLLIRSHECVKNGYHWTHNDKVVTVFSVSNYYSPGSNAGAYLVVQWNSNDKSDRKYSISAKSYDRLLSPHADNPDLQNKLVRRQAGRLDMNTLAFIAEHCKANFTEIEQGLFDAVKENPTDEAIGEWMTTTQFKNVLSEKMDLHIPWTTLLRTISDKDYEAMLTEHPIKNKGKVLTIMMAIKCVIFLCAPIRFRNLNEVQVQSLRDSINTMMMVQGSDVWGSLKTDNEIPVKLRGVADLLYTRRSDVEAIFRMIDRDKSGTISQQEFGDLFTVLHKTEEAKEHESDDFSDGEIKDLFSKLDINKDGKIDLNEFLEGYRISNMRHSLQMRDSFGSDMDG
eukprot:Clim_evm89s236 gene=Clim_evmTU89s236